LQPRPKRFFPSIFLSRDSEGAGCKPAPAKKKSGCWTGFATPSETFLPFDFFYQEIVKEQVANLLQQKRDFSFQQGYSILNWKSASTSDKLLAKRLNSLPSTY